MSLPTLVFYLQDIFYKINANIKPSLWIAFWVFCLHCAVIFFLLRDHSLEKVQSKEELIKFRLLKPESFALAPPQINLYVPHAIVLSKTDISLPEITLADPVGENKKSGKDFEDYNKNGSVIFDPRLRKKLSEMQVNTFDSGVGLEAWVDSSGAQVVEINEGRCIKSMSGAGGGEHGINWSLPFKCGKNESDRMIDNINKDLAERKKRK